MGIGSLVECMVNVRFNSLRSFLAGATGLRLPKKGEFFIVEDIQRCTCGQHNNLKLHGLETDWPEVWFEERQKAGEVNIEELLK